MTFYVLSDLLNKLDDPCSSVRCAAVECVAVFKIDTSDPMYDEEGQSYLAETIISRLILYLDDPFVKMRPILLGKYLKYMDIQYTYKSRLFSLICYSCLISFI